MKYEYILSNTIRNALVSKMNFSLGFSLISATLKAKRPLQTKMDTEGELDYSPIEAAKLAKIKWQVFQDHVRTLDVVVTPLSEIIESYIKSSRKTVQHAPDSVLAIRARVSGCSIEQLRNQAEAGAKVAEAKLRAAVAKCAEDFSDLESYTNEWYSSVGIEDHEEKSVYIELDDIFTDAWVVDKYEDAVKSQTAYWSKYNNWDDAELVLIDEDLKMLRA